MKVKGWYLKKENLGLMTYTLEKEKNMPMLIPLFTLMRLFHKEEFYEPVIEGQWVTSWNHISQ